MGYSRAVSHAVYIVAGMSCEHCTSAVRTEILALAGVDDVTADLTTKRVEVKGQNLDDAAIRAAIEEAGYEAA